MTTSVYRFEFDRAIPLTEAEASLQLATFAAEGLFSQARIRMELSYHVDEPRRAIIADGTTAVGNTVIKMFTALLIREFGELSFQVRRVTPVASAS
ncbi:MAG: hypothetical protein WD294_02175 [Phycisphaeraceae bacterium]